VRLEPLNAASHGDDLFEIATVPDAADRAAYRVVRLVPIADIRRTRLGELMQGLCVARFARTPEVGFIACRAKRVSLNIWQQAGVLCL
jgi:hypothetical protein